MKAIPGDTWFPGRGGGLRWDWGFPNPLQINRKRGLRLLYCPSPGTIQYFPTCDCEDKTSHLHTGTKKRPTIVWFFLSRVCLERLLSTMDAILCCKCIYWFVFSSRDLTWLTECCMSAMEQQTEPTEEEKKASEVLNGTVTNSQIEPHDISFGKGSDESSCSSIFCPSWWWSLFQEERLREEAAKRLERRRKKMLSPEERLARWFLSLFSWHLNQTMKVNCWLEWNQERLVRWSLF